MSELELVVVGPSGCGDHEVALVFSVENGRFTASAHDYHPELSGNVNFRWTDAAGLMNFWPQARRMASLVAAKSAEIGQELIDAFAFGQTCFVSFIEALLKLLGKERDPLIYFARGLGTKLVAAQ